MPGPRSSTGATLFYRADKKYTVQLLQRECSHSIPNKISGTKNPMGRQKRGAQKIVDIDASADRSKAGGR